MLKATHLQEAELGFESGPLSLLSPCPTFWTKRASIYLEGASQSTGTKIHLL